MRVYYLSGVEASLRSKPSETLYKPLTYARSGSDGIAEAVKRFDGGVVVLPESVRQPSVAKRIRGMTLENVERMGVPIVVAD